MTWWSPYLFQGRLAKQTVGQAPHPDWRICLEKCNVRFFGEICYFCQFLECLISLKKLCFQGLPATKLLAEKTLIITNLDGKDSPLGQV